MILHCNRESETHFVNEWGLFLFYCKKFSLRKEAWKSKKKKKYNEEVNQKVEKETNLQS